MEFENCIQNNPMIYSFKINSKQSKFISYSRTLILWNRKTTFKYVKVFHVVDRLETQQNQKGGAKRPINLNKGLPRSVHYQS